ncbi:DNA-protecting protein DprA, partial [Clostridium botulinum]|nr:DNA-protecting protein DprA [Clostridium botulinum]
MLNYELWFILLDITNKEKINLIDKYENEENIYNNFENILKENKKLQKKLGNFEKNDLIYQIISLNNTLNQKDIGYITYSNPLYKERLKLFSPASYYLF